MERAGTWCVLLSMERTPGQGCDRGSVRLGGHLLPCPAFFALGSQRPACTQPCPILRPCPSYTCFSLTGEARPPECRKVCFRVGSRPGRGRGVCVGGGLYRVQMSWREWPRCPWSVGVAVAPALGGGVRQEALEQLRCSVPLGLPCPPPPKPQPPLGSKPRQLPQCFSNFKCNT